MIKLSNYIVEMGHELYEKFFLLHMELDNLSFAERLGYKPRNSSVAGAAINHIIRKKRMVASRFPLFLKIIDRRPSTLTKKDIEIYPCKVRERDLVDDKMFKEIIEMFGEIYDNENKAEELAVTR
jgi:hypothetical protein